MQRLMLLCVALLLLQSFSFLVCRKLFGYLYNAALQSLVREITSLASVTKHSSAAIAAVDQVCR